MKIGLDKIMNKGIDYTDVDKRFDKADLSTEQDCEYSGESESVHSVLDKERVKSHLHQEIGRAKQEERNKMIAYIRSTLDCKIPNKLCSMHRTHDIREALVIAEKENL